MKNRAIVLGLDGATWDIINPLIEKGRLPTFSKLKKEGVYGKLESTIPYVTPPAWTSMTTGKNPAKHGIFDFTNINKKNGYSYKMYNSKSKKSKEIWDLLDNQRSIIVNVPLTYPPKEINGSMITGMYTPDKLSSFTYPPALKELIVNNFPNYQIELKWQRYCNDKDSFLKDLYKMTKARIDLFWHLFEKNWDFLFFVFIGTDRLQHLLYDDKHLAEYYEYLDKFLCDLLNKLDDSTNLFLVSDHGFAETDKKIYLNQYFVEKGYLKLKEKDKSKSFLDKLNINKENLHNKIRDYGLKDTFDRLPSEIKNILRNTVPGNSSPLFDFDLSKSKAFMTGSGRIYTLDKDDEDLRYNIIQELESLKDPDSNQKIINKVYKKEELYNGKLLGDSADLIVLPNKGFKLFQSISDNLIEKPNDLAADHSLNGIFLSYGANIKHSNEMNEFKIYDIAPTIIHHYNLPVPKDIDGRVLKEIFKEDSGLYKSEIKYSKSEEKEKLKETIRNLKI